jgi:hypothetical protein
MILPHNRVGGVPHGMDLGRCGGNEPFESEILFYPLQTRADDTGYGEKG